MVNKYCFDALDKTLRDIMWENEENTNKLVGGLTIVFEGDFRQILLVVLKGMTSDIVDASITSFYLEPKFKILNLRKTMRLTENNEKITLLGCWPLLINGWLRLEMETANCKQICRVF